jgi:hypothetical protein
VALLNFEQGSGFNLWGIFPGGLMLQSSTVVILRRFVQGSCCRSGCHCTAIRLCLYSYMAVTVQQYSTAVTAVTVHVAH